MNIPNGSSQPRVALKAGPAAARSFGRAANWAVGCAAAVLVLISVAGYFCHREHLSAIAAGHLRLIVTGPSVLHGGLAAEYLVSATSIGGQPLPAEIEIALLAPDGKRLKAYKESADDRGRLRFVIPADLNLPPQVKMRVVAWYRESREETELPLRCEAAECVTCVALDGSRYRPGEVVRYRSLTLPGFSLEAGREWLVNSEVLDPDGVAAPNSRAIYTTRQGVGSGQFTIPGRSALGQYTLVVRSPDGDFPEQRRPFWVVAPPAGGDAPDRPDDRAAEPGKVEVAFHPEGGGLAAELENRVYFTARDSLGKPVRLSGTIVAERQDEGEAALAVVKTAFDGMGIFSFIPLADEVCRLKIAKPADVEDRPTLPAVAAERDIVLTTGKGVFAAAEPLEFNIRAAKAGLPLVAAAYCRGVQVGQQPLVTKSGVNPVAIVPDAAACGAIRLCVYDYSVAPPKLAAERTVYRRPARRLNVQATCQKERYAPGETVDVSILITDEQAAPVQAALGLAVVARPAPSSDADCPPSMAALFLLNGRTERTDGLGDAGFCLSDRTRDGMPAAVALDLLLGTQPAVVDGRPAPPAIFDNVAQIRDDYQKTLFDYRTDQTSALNTLTTVSFFGGMGLVLLVAMLGLMRIVSGIHLWVAAVGATTCCLIVGAILMDPGRLPTEREPAAPFAAYHAPSPEADEPSDPLPAKKSLGAAGPAAQADAALFWEPLLTTDSDGKASFQFKLPDAAGTFCVSVDAHGAGRIGSGRTEIVVVAPAASEPPAD